MITEFWEFIIQIFPYALAFTAPILITALGGLFSERSGITNIGLEGLMVVGAFASTLFIHQFGEGLGDFAVWIALLVAMVSGIIFSLLHAYASINLKADQVISGTAINMLATALTVFFARIATGSGNIAINKFIPRADVFILKDIPIIGPLFFQSAYATTFIAFFLVFVTWYLVFNTKFGLRLRACGEHPEAADSVGIDVYKMRYIGVMFSGAFAALGGAIIMVTYAGEFNGTVSGLGFLAIAALVFGQWDPFKILLATIFFGFMRTLGTMALINDTIQKVNLPTEFYTALPYVMTIIALIVFSKNAVGPKAAGKPYEKTKK